MSKWLDLEPYDRCIPWRVGTNNETILHELLNSLKDGERVKATWRVDQIKATAEGPVSKDDLYCSCFQTIRWADGDIFQNLTSLEVVRDGEVYRWERYVGE